MQEGQRKQIKEKIIAKISEIEEEIKQLEESAKPISPDSAYGRISRVDAMNNQAITESTLNDKRTEIQRYKYTLNRIDTEEYGKCAKCGNDINFKRLLSIPYANLCISCANRFR